MLCAFDGPSEPTLRIAEGAQWCQQLLLPVTFSEAIGKERLVHVRIGRR